ncbi:MAG: SpoIIE family protein phosphatase [Lachnospiraceae bacterium]|nr:SpoIIE family protein phosphatase [Lachnospiraceae bacterium]
MKKSIRIIEFLLCLILLIQLAPRPCGASNAGTGINASGGRNRTLAVDPSASPEGYSPVLYDNTSGLPTSEANAIAQTSDGFIWIGSYSGLIQYDGNTFVRMDSTTGISSVVCLYTDTKDRLWIGTNDSGFALMEEKTGEFRKWGKADGLGSSYINAFAEDSSGNIYIATTEGLMMMDETMTLKPLENDDFDRIPMKDLRTGNDGYVYGLTTEGDIFTIKEGHMVTYLDHENNPVSNIMCILPDPENPNHLYIGVEDSVIYHVSTLRGRIRIEERLDITPLTYIESLEKVRDQLWICAGNGMGSLSEDGFHQVLNVPMDNSIGHFMTDYEGDLWFTSTRQGVMKITPNQFSDLYERYNLPDAVVNSTCLYGDDLFIGTDTGLTVLDTANGPIGSVPIHKAETASGVKMDADDLITFLDGCRIRSIIRDSKNRLWISTWRKYGLLCFDNGDLTAYTEEEGLFSGRVRTVYECEDGSILVVNSGGVSVIKDGRVARSYSSEDGIVNTEGLTVVEGFKGEIILGTDGGGIYVIKEDGTLNLDISSGLESEIVMRIKRDNNRDLYWIVTSNSIAYMSSDYEITTIQNFPYSNNFDLYENKDDDIWVFSSNGIYVTPAEELLANGEIESVYYGIYSGLTCIPTANSYSDMTRFGNLYISGTTGVARINVNTAYGKISNLKAAIPYIDADDTRLFPNENGEFALSSRIRKITIHGYVFNYSLNNPMVSYYLDGFDRKEVTFARSEMTPIDYTNLPGGEYEFTMKLMDSMGRGNKTISVRIVKEKAFYEQISFYALLSLFVFLAILFGVQAYVDRRMQVLELKHKEEAEKERITHELTMANKIQESMLPNIFPAFPDRNEFDIYASMEPAKEVGGDFYDFYMIDDDHLGLVIADVSGKGVPASLVMMITKSIMQSYAMLGVSAGEILTKTNESLCANNKMDMFVTAWCGILELSTGKLTAANAGHEYPTAYHVSDGVFQIVKDKHGFVLGGMEGMMYRQYELQLMPGDKIFVYTDGVPEATNADNELFGTERMIEALNKKPDAHPAEILTTVREAVSVFVGPAEQFDDLTMLCIEYKG